MHDSLKDIVALSAVRTPSGKFGGSFCDVPVFSLGATAIRAAVSRAGVSVSQISDVLFGCCRHTGNGTNPARTAARFAGLPPEVPATTITMACASGMRAVILGIQSLLSGDSDLLIAGGMESMSTIPYLLTDSRWEGLRLGHKLLIDGWDDSRDPFIQDQKTGVTTEELIRKHRISREEQDEYALESHRRAANAADQGLFDAEIVSTLTDHKGGRLTRDETIRPNSSLEDLAKLKPVFAQRGTLTAGNSSALSDGAAAFVLTRRETAHELGAEPLFSVISYATGAVENQYMGEGPSIVFPSALKRAKMTLQDIDFVELNEGFAGMALVNEKLLKLDRTKTNVNGGAIALGHPVGASGARILVTLYHILKHFDRDIGGAVIGAAGGVCTSMIIRRES